MMGPSGDDLKRLFIGVSVPEHYLARIREFHESQPEVSGLRWVPELNLHITVFFLGAIQVEMIENVKSLISYAVNQFESFALVADRFCFGPSERQARMIWLRFHRHKTFSAFSGQLFEYFLQLNPRLQSRKKPLPHITLARFPEGTNLESFSLNSRISGEKLEIKQLVLWESLLTPQGAVYIPLAKFDFIGH